MNNRAKAQSLFLRAIVYISAGLTIGSLLLLIAYILIKGLPNITPDLFSLKYTSENVSLFPALINTISMTILSLLVSAPLGIFSAIYLSEYAKKDSKLVKLIRLTSETLAGIPSIVYGLFGSIFFVEGIFKGYCLVAGALTVGIMILPVVMTTTEEALKSIPNSFREGSFGLGAGKLRTVFKIVLPSAVPGIFAGIVICIGRIVGETAALIYTAGTVPQIPQNLLGSGRTLSVHMYALWNEGLNQNEAYATAVVLLISVIILNAISDILAKKIAKKF
ncbi:MAG: phosphate ABC transporter permease PstA [Oscillospiraceae bacterium]